ncbi:hypothetical protein CTAYLR_002813 [Chrysophaeum taylorii]|uniref:Cilia- and flagella-associated protein 36 n=1 Tax=Chrysophaeum taylorii TaxID=2483200 RepID=A0AAD7U896_9STRA|nr:hypothetical protein CTAYLR_002813 [Chrysophaeum taylorii]
MVVAGIVERVAKMLFEDDAFADELERWCEARCDVFDGIEGEHAFDHTTLHKEFCLLFEARIEAFLREEGFTVAEFWQRLMKVVDDGKDASFKGEGLVLEALQAATDYTAFATTMRAMRREKK